MTGFEGGLTNLVVFLHRLATFLIVGLHGFLLGLDVVLLLRLSVFHRGLSGFLLTDIGFFLVLRLLHVFHLRLVGFFLTDIGFLLVLRLLNVFHLTVVGLFLGDLNVVLGALRLGVTLGGGNLFLVVLFLLLRLVDGLGRLLGKLLFLLINAHSRFLRLGLLISILSIHVLDAQGAHGKHCQDSENDRFFHIDLDLSVNVLRFVQKAKTVPEKNHGKNKQLSP